MLDDGILVELWPKMKGVLAGAGSSCGAGDPKLNTGLGAVGCVSPPKILFPGSSCPGWAAELKIGADDAGWDERKENGLLGGLVSWAAVELKLIVDGTVSFGVLDGKANGLLCVLVAEVWLKLNMGGAAGCDVVGLKENGLSAGFGCVLA